MEFIRRIVRDIYDGIEENRFGHACQIQDMAFVFPTKRAGLYLKKHIAEYLGPAHASWLPEIFSITEWVQSVSKRTFPDQLSLLLDLYRVMPRDESSIQKRFESFYPWGKMILSDFNDIDQNVLDPSIFREIRELSEIDDSDLTLQQNYSQLLKALDRLYHAFTEYLKTNNATYYGLAIRELISEFDQPEQANQRYSKWKKIIFSGFNFLTAGEEQLLALLKEKGIAHFYWDIDHYFYSDPDNEAGSYFRSSPLIDDSAYWIDNALSTQAKQIDIVGTPGNTGQAKIAGNLLAQHLSRHEQASGIAEKTALILSDESLLFPVLNALPPSIDRVNISMGSPVTHAAPYHFIILILQTVILNRKHDRQQSFPFEEIRRILQHPYIQNQYHDMVSEFINHCQSDKKTRVELSDLDQLDETLFRLFSYQYKLNPIALFNYIETIILFTKRSLLISGNRLELEYLFEIFKQINRIRDTFSTQRLDIPPDDLVRIIRDILENAIIPFSGEPLAGLQILGMLETRAIDFDHVFLLSVNEGIFPKGKTVQSLIPNDIRQQKGMSYYQKRDSIFAYYFYRILKTAKKVTILYNTESDNFNKGDKSRFINQLKYELKQINNQAGIRETIMTFNPSFDAPVPIAIGKTPEILGKLRKLIFSASAVNAWLYCPLRFFFRYIRKIKEYEELTDRLDARSFGTVIHDILEMLYTPFIDKQLEKSDLGRFRKELSKTVSNYFNNKLSESDLNRGKPYIDRIIIEHLLEKYFRLQETELPLKIIALEKEFNAAISVNNDTGTELIRLTGRIDRLDEQDNMIRVLDYKTGQFKRLNWEIDDDSDVDEMISALQKNKEVMQLVFYNYLLSQNQITESNWRKKFGIVYFKALSKGTVYLDSGQSEMSFDLSSKRILTAVLSRIFDTSEQFTQTENRENCTVCPYKDICQK